MDGTGKNPADKEIQQKHRQVRPAMPPNRNRPIPTKDTTRHIPDRMLDNPALRQRGWSKYMIRTLLPEPDMRDTRRNAHYEPDRIATLETDPAVHAQLQYNIQVRQRTMNKEPDPRTKERQLQSEEEIERNMLQHRAENPPPSEPTITHAELMERGWTRSMIRQVLIKPDYQPWRGSPQYFTARVEAHEKRTTISAQITHQLQERSTKLLIEQQNLTPEQRHQHQRAREKRQEKFRLERRSEEARTRQNVSAASTALREEQKKDEIEDTDLQRLMTNRPHKGGPVWST